MIMRLLMLSILLIGLPALLVLSDMKKLPWQHPKFDTVLSTLPATTHNYDILIFSKTNGFRHKSIEPGILAITKAAADRGWTVQATENGAIFNTESLRTFKVIVFLSTTGDILTQEQKVAFEQFVENGGGYAGVHSASDTEHNWPWYDRLLGTHFKSHTLFPKHIAEAEINTETSSHTATKHLPKRWAKRDEWYNFKSNVRGKEGIEILLSLNEASYTSIFPKRMGADHPIAWTNLMVKGRMFYTAMGHNSETFANPDALQHILGGIEWAGKL